MWESLNTSTLTPFWQPDLMWYHNRNTMLVNKSGPITRSPSWNWIKGTLHDPTVNLMHHGGGGNDSGVGQHPEGEKWGPVTTRVPVWIRELHPDGSVDPGWSQALDRFFRLRRFPFILNFLKSFLSWKGVEFFQVFFLVLRWPCGFYPLFYWYGIL